MPMSQVMPMSQGRVHARLSNEENTERRRRLFDNNLAHGERPDVDARAPLWVGQEPEGYILTSG